jgi:hypothetical protein
MFCLKHTYCSCIFSQIFCSVDDYVLHVWAHMFHTTLMNMWLDSHHESQRTSTLGSHTSRNTYPLMFIRCPFKEDFNSARSLLVTFCFHDYACCRAGGHTRQVLKGDTRSLTHTSHPLNLKYPPQAFIVMLKIQSHPPSFRANTMLDCLPIMALVPSIPQTHLVSGSRHA